MTLEVVLAQFQVYPSASKCLIGHLSLTERTNKWTAPGTRYLGKLIRPRAYNVKIIGTKITFSDYIKIPKENDILFMTVCEIMIFL